MAHIRCVCFCRVNPLAGLMATVLEGYAQDYLRLRRVLGATLNGHGQLISSFLTSLNAAGQEAITIDEAVRWACLPADAAPRWRAYRLAVIRGYAAFIHAQDPSLAQIIPPKLIPSRVVHAIPYIYTPQQILELMEAALGLAPPARGLTLSTVIGLMAVTGMRIGETLALDFTDIDLGTGVITVTGKYGKKRLVPVHPSTTTSTGAGNS